MKKFEFFNESVENWDYSWDEVYSNALGDHHYSLISILDYCVSLNDKITLSLLPEHSEWPPVNDYIFSEIDDLDITSVQEFLKDMGYDITIDGICIFKYETQHQGYIKSTTGQYTSLPKVVNKFISDDDFMSKLEELMNISGIQVNDNALSEFMSLVNIRNKVKEALPYFSEEV